MAGRQLVQDVAGPGAGGVPAHVGEDQGALVAGQVGPRRPVAGPQRLGQVEVDEHGPGARRAADHLGGRHGRVVPVGDHAAVAVDGHRDGHRRVPALEPAGPLQVHVLLLGQGAPAEVGVVVVPERRGQGGAQAEPAGGDGQVGDAARAGAHPVGPDLGAVGRHALQAGEDDVEEDRPPQEDVELRPVRLPAGGQRVVRGLGRMGHERGSWGAAAGRRRGHSARCASPLTRQNRAEARRVRASARDVAAIFAL